MRCLLASLVILLGTAACSRHQPSGSLAHEEGAEAGLVTYMSSLQRYTAKLGFAAQARNAKLARFYVEESLEITSDIRENVPEYDGHSVGLLTRIYLKSRLEDLNESLESERWSTVATQYSELIDACNRCHQSTDHEYIVIEEPSGKPWFNQRFSPS